MHYCGQGRISSRVLQYNGRESNTRFSKGLITALQTKTDKSGCTNDENYSMLWCGHYCTIGYLFDNRLNRDFPLHSSSGGASNRWNLSPNPPRIQTWLPLLFESEPLFMKQILLSVGNSHGELRSSPVCFLIRLPYLFVFSASNRSNFFTW